MRIALAALVTLAASAVSATPMDDRGTAMEVLQHASSVERTFSNCRYIRGAGNPDLLREWRDGNMDFVDAAKRVVDNQGGLTPARRRIVDAVAVMFEQESSASREACQAFFSKVARGEYDVPVKVQSPRLRGMLSTRREDAPDRLWIVDQRRLPNGTLAHVAKPYLGEGGIRECDDGAAAKGHVWTRTRLTNAGEAVKDEDPDLWMSECVASDVDPVTGKEPAEAPPRT